MTAPAPSATGTYLGFKPHLRVEAVPGEAVYLISDQRVTALRGEQVAQLAPLLDGTRRRDSVLREAAGTMPTEQADRLVARLTRAGLLAERPACPAPEAAPEHVYWEAAGLAGAAAADRLRTSTVHVTAVGRADAGELRRAAEAAGLRTAPAAQSGDADLTLVHCEDYLDPALKALDAEHRAAGRRWLPVKSGGTQTWIGPFFGAADGPCWSCLADRLWRGRWVEAHVQRMLHRSGPLPRPSCALSASRLAGLHLAVLEAVKWLGGHRHAGQRQLWTLDGLELAGERHPVQRRPQCPACGDPELMHRQVHSPVTLAPRPKQDVGGGGHRALTAQQMLERYRHLVDPLTGLIKEIRRDPRGPAFLNSFHAGHNPASGTRGLTSLRSGLRSTSSGKGTTPLQARVGALGEAMERHCGHLQGDEPVCRASLRELGDEAVHPDSVQLYDPRQYRDRHRWNAEHSHFHHVGDPFDENAEIEWTPVWSLTSRRHRLLPTSLLYYGSAQLAAGRYCHANSNGTAAGGSLEEAVLQGFLELVERDAVALWWYNRTAQPGLDLDSFADPWIAELRTVHASLHREIWALDLTPDLGIPVFAALSRRTDKPAEDIVLGFGAHFDPRIALRRALAETNQLLPPVLGARPDGNGYAITDPETLSWMRTARTDNQPYLLPDPAARAVRPADHPYVPRSDLLEDIAAAEDVVARAGLELLVLDQTRPDVGLPVVRVIVPGLRPHWARFAPGRLFDVPVRLGRLCAPTPYEDLNPVPLFL
ncbi:bacteriocin biosynthesis cyclodehydratase domain-containing protein [Streptomyces sp. V4I23]|uniref:TOMM precursor leader peptide-binding protein n=1 Tax=Streptomyces sp. V4I23 TaxID=3042282 RepID=UPI00278734F8|nr:TOMM precursor leader peptide-binding protein [Streptomyces sp. V4I23]MDQ1008575.1 bacteriocin biosynthesis cyclodehydratase domain-containing protein [Streptomyces sp. V4I23]